MSASPARTADTVCAGPLHAVTGGDENYVPGIMVLAGSLWRHNPGARLTVLGLGLSEASTALMRQLAAAVGAQIEILAVDETAVDGLAITNRYLSVATYLRLEIPRLLPQAAKVIYLDSDMVVTGSLAPLWQMELGDALIAAVPDPGVDSEELCALNCTAGEYVNSGLLVMNLDLWRAEGIAATCRQALCDPDRRMRYEDQSAINLVCRGRVLHLPVVWNFWSRYHSLYSKTEISGPPAVVHFLGVQKPWLYCGAPAEALWLAEAAALPIRLPALERKPVQKPGRHAAARVERWLRLRLFAALGVGRYPERYRRSVQAKVDAERQLLWEKRFILPHIAAISALGCAPSIAPARTASDT